MSKSLIGNGVVDTDDVIVKDANNKTVQSNNCTVTVNPAA